MSSPAPHGDPARTAPGGAEPLRPATGRHTRRFAVIAAAATAVFVGGALVPVLRGGGGAGDLATAGPAPALVNAAGNRDALGVETARTQQLLRADPSNAANWAALGADYVQQARITLDAAYYPKAQGALERSLALVPTNNLGALIGMGTLANSRHDFAGALAWGLRAQQVSSFNPDVYVVLTDAYTQLGQPAQASAAVQRLLDLSPTLPALTRGSYDLEQRGELPRARAMLQRALDEAYVPADIGFCRYYLGELAIHSGDLAEASRQYDRGLVADPSSATLLEGRAKVAALRGDTAAAVAGYDNLVQRVPNPQYLIEYGELLTKLGRTGEAQAQFDLIETEHKLFTANGGQDDLTLAEYEADHGSPSRAVQYAKAEWARRKMAVVADTLGWALHRAGRDSEALPYADTALARGWRNEVFVHHRSEIERALGRTGAAGLDRARLDGIDARFDPQLAALSRPT